MADGLEHVSPSVATMSSTVAAEPTRRRIPRRWLVVALLLASVLAELVGRTYGLHTPVIYEVTDYGYRVAPNQDIRRFGHLIRYDAMGLRNDPVTPEPSAGVMRILCLGDSVANGGAITSQDETVSAQLESILRQRLRGPVEVLNASAPGWAVANELGWLKASGILGSAYVVLIISTHDLFQELAPSSIVDNHPSFPSSRPVLALQDVVRHYLLPRLIPDSEQKDPGAAGVQVSDVVAEANRDAVLAIARFVEERHGRLVVVFLEQAGDSDHDPRTLGAKRQLFALLGKREIPVVTLGNDVERFGREVMFLDDVHPNPAGNQVIASEISRELELMVAGPKMTVGFDGAR